MSDAAFEQWLDRLDRDGYLDAELILSELFVHLDAGGRPCRCSCHPSLGSPDRHDGEDCPCTLTEQQRAEKLRELWDGIDAERAAWEASPEGQAELAREAAEQAELEAWIEADRGVEISSWGGTFPEQWWGTVDGHSFYFREKRGHWRIELDLRPTGRFYERVVVPVDEDAAVDLTRTERVEVEVGEVIAEGSANDLGIAPLHHGRFIINTIRTWLRRQGCPHSGARRYCPECGEAMA